MKFIEIANIPRQLKAVRVACSDRTEYLAFYNASKDCWHTLTEDNGGSEDYDKLQRIIDSGAEGVDGERVIQRFYAGDRITIEL